MRLYLDDERPVPDGWVGVKTAPECIAILRSGVVDALSLDHDLGPVEAGTGYEVVCWMEYEFRNNPEFVLPDVLMVHSQNPVGAQKMKDVLRSLKWAKSGST